jgi:hypothetical protein
MLLEELDTIHQACGLSVAVFGRANMAGSLFNEPVQMHVSAFGGTLETQAAWRQAIDSARRAWARDPGLGKHFGGTGTHCDPRVEYCLVVEGAAKEARTTTNIEGLCPRAREAMKILAVAKIDPRTTPQTMQPHLDAEVRYAWKLYKEGIVREMYDRPDRRGVVFVLECRDAGEARTILNELPFVRERLIDFEIIPLQSFSYFETLYRD